jgi:hypothetical protein
LKHSGPMTGMVISAPFIRSFEERASDEELVYPSSPHVIGYESLPQGGKPRSRTA